MNALDLVRELIALPGPPGQEDAVRDRVAEHVRALGYAAGTDPKGNLLIPLGPDPRIVVTAHLDEIAMIVRGMDPEGGILVAPMGGLHPWKLGEGPVEVMAPEGGIAGILSFGSIHSEDAASAARSVEANGLGWGNAKVLTGYNLRQLIGAGVRPGTRVALGRSRRTLTPLGNSLVSGPFLDDRADLAAMLLALGALRGQELPVLFAATVAEEVGGEGAQYLMHRLQPDVCIALELAPLVPDAPITLDATPALWVSDSFAAIRPSDIRLVEAAAREAGTGLQFQALSRGGSDASCAAARGLCARPITLGIPMENSHGCEIMHADAVDALARLTAALLGVGLGDVR
ncbi:MAG: hypothetical protein AMXMBFR81_13000 [Chthonomonas sp.]